MQSLTSHNVQISEYTSLYKVRPLYIFVSQLHICEWASEYVEGRGAVLVAGSVVDKEWERISGCITEVTLGADLGHSVVWIV